MKDINLENALKRQRKIEKTRRIQAEIQKKKRRNKKIALTVETLIISAIIYILLGQFGELATKGGIYTILIVCGWIWLLGGQFGVLYTIWCDSNER